jgi:ABC-type dipeptide/oligopeptide/nickel transport system permease component
MRRLLLMIPTFIGATMLVFFAGFALPGDPVAALGGERAMTPSVRENLIERYHLDEPIWRQYVLYMGDVVRLDLGESILRRRQVNDIFREVFPRTLQLAGLAIVIEVVIGLLAGVVAALKKDKFLDQLVLVSTTFAVAIPVFVLGFAAQTVFGIALDWFPVGGIQDGWLSYILPAFVLATLSLAYVARLTRTTLTESLREDYIQTAKAKGLPQSRVVGRHALRNALVPVVTFIGLDLAALMGGAVITETVFNIPGMGSTIVSAIGQRDHAIVVGFTMAAIVIYLLASLVIDLFYAVLDPRIRYE